jgi:hypothetical protein
MTVTKDQAWTDFQYKLNDMVHAGYTPQVWMDRNSYRAHDELFGDLVEFFEEDDYGTE